MITEDYVSFETAKLLKEKGFDEVTSKWYLKYKGEYILVSRGSAEHPDSSIDVPTLQMTMKWLRNIHSLEIYPYHDYREGNDSWWFEIIRFRSSYAEHESDSTYHTYEEACEAAIRYCLEKLI